MDFLRRPALAEDTVQYRLFLAQPDPSDTRAAEQCLQQHLERVLAQCAPLLVQYIWQDQTFNIKYCPEKGGVPAHLAGSTRFGDNVEDEWFIVYLMLEITRAFPLLAARVEDNDGEFLLIEAADCLPRWLSPESSENRVFLYRGDLHIIPAPPRPGAPGWPPEVTPSLPQALALLCSHPQSCLAAQPIRSAVAKRVTGAFYLRTPLDLRCCRPFSTFTPESCVLTSALQVTFTRCLYAQLQGQTFTPDRRSGFTLPPRSDPRYRAHELGMKLAHGFEILVSKCRQPSSELGSPVSCSPLWGGFLDSLQKSGYFRGELEGSARYRELLHSAERFFRQSITVPQSSGGLSPGQEVLQELQSCPLNVEELRERESQLPPEDSDSWLEISPEDLERLLQETTGRATGSSNPCKRATQEEEEAGYSLVAVTKSVKAFINKVSSHEGAELPWSQSESPFTFDASSMASAVDRIIGTALLLPLLGPGLKGAEALGSLRRYMDQMDQELAGTHIGHSFAQPAGVVSHCPPPTAGGSTSTPDRTATLSTGMYKQCHLVTARASLTVLHPELGCLITQGQLQEYSIILLYAEEGHSPVGSEAARLDSPTLQRCFFQLSSLGMDPVILLGGLSAFRRLYPFLCTPRMVLLEPERRALTIYPSEILEGALYQGSAAQAQDYRIIKNLHITHVVNATADSPDAFPSVLRYLRLRLSDDTQQDVGEALPLAARFIAGALQGGGGRVLVHCSLGRGRSSALTLAFLMEHRRWPLCHAYRWLQERRGCAAPNAGFLRQLAVYEERLFGQRLTTLEDIRL
ncbi:ECD protein, partial [Amia calva]|nr:ECD protein [Amia calva]